MALMIRVTVTDSGKKAVGDYLMDHDKLDERRHLGLVCREAFEAGQTIHTQPILNDGHHETKHKEFHWEARP